VHDVGSRAARVAIYAFLVWHSLLVLYPIFIMVSSSFRPTMEQFRRPFGLPTTLYLGGYAKVLAEAHFGSYLWNSVLVTAGTLALLLVVSLLAANALARYDFPGGSLLTLFLLAGIMIPIKVATLPLLMLMRAIGLYDSLVGLVLIYTATHISVSVYILMNFLRLLPGDVMDAARIDGCSELSLLGRITTPMIRPALATVAIFNFVPIWNDLWFPLIFVRSEEKKTVQQGIAIFFGQYETDWVAVFAAITLAALPVLTLYLFMSRQFIRGLTAGAVK
jgi:raffinose/stachyose/melibiose transport system permease protein